MAGTSRGPRVATCGEAKAGEASEGSPPLDWLIDGWLRDPYSERILCEIDRELGGVRPGAPSARELAEYHRELKHRIRRAAEWGRLQVAARHLPTGVGEKREPPPLPKPAQEQQRGLSIVVQMETGDPVDDDAGFVLVRPDGTEVNAQLSQGEFREGSSPQGTHEVRFKHLRNARWSVDSMRCGEEAGLSVEARGFRDGEAIVFKVYEEWHPDGVPPVVELRATIEGGTAKATWRHEQKPGRPAHGEYVFEAELG